MLHTNEEFIKDKNNLLYFILALTRHDTNDANKPVSAILNCVHNLPLIDDYKSPEAKWEFAAIRNVISLIEREEIGGVYTRLSNSMLKFVNKYTEDK